MRLRSCSCVAVAVLAAAPIARGDGALPFSKDELAHALRVRVAAAHRVAVRAGVDAIEVTVDGRAATVVLGDERGPDAARLVALVAAGLVLDDPPLEPAPELRAPATIAPLAVAATRPSGHRRWSLLAHGVAAMEDHAARTAGLSIELAGRGRWRWTAAIGGERTAGGDPMGVDLYGVPARIGGERGDRLAIGASAIAAVVVTGEGGGDAGVLVGAGVHGRVQAALAPPFGLVVEVGVDVMANQIEYRWDGEATLRTGRVRPWLALGLTWGGP